MSYSSKGDGVLRYQGRLCVLDVDNMRGKILKEAHESRYSIHPGATKIYHDLQEVYGWEGLKMDIEKFVTRCPNCQQVKTQHKRLSGLTQLMNVPTWKWEDIYGHQSGSPWTCRKNDSIWVIVYRLRKSANFIPINSIYLVEEYARLYLEENMGLHAIHLSIFRIEVPNLLFIFGGYLKKGKVLK